MAKLFRVIKEGSGHDVGTVVMRVPALLMGLPDYKYLGVWFNKVLPFWNKGASLKRVKCTKHNLRTFDKSLRKARSIRKRHVLHGV